jgi:hypothetical protein
MDFASQNLTMGQMNAIVKKLGGAERAGRFLRDELIVTLRPPVFSVWKTIKLGTGLKTADDFRNAINSAGAKIDLPRYLNNLDLLDKSVSDVANEEIEVDLVKISVNQLMDGGAEWQNVIMKALNLGLRLCSPEVGPQLLLQYGGQSDYEYLCIGMSGLSIFRWVGNNKQRTLCEASGHAVNFLLGSEELVFVLPRK